MSTFLDRASHAFAVTNAVIDLEHKGSENDTIDTVLFRTSNANQGLLR